MNSIYINVRHTIMDFLRNMLWKCNRLFPIDNNKVVVSCFKGRGYCDNPKYIVEQLLGINKKVKIVWLINSKKEAESLPKTVVPCYINRLSAVYHYITALVWIDNTRKDIKFKKKDKQFYLQTWHGGGAIKKVERDVQEQLSKAYISYAKKDSEASDLFISEGRFYSNLYRKSFWYTGKIAEVGLPRYDIVYQKDKDINLRKKVFNYFGLEIDKKVILYAPTFRKGYGFEAYDIDYISVIAACERRFGGEYVSFVHLHPNVANKFEELKYDGVKIINATQYPDMQELITVADIMIGDYSSAIVDFSLTKKPAFRYATDALAYEKERGEYFDIITGYPYPLATNNSELIECILEFDEKKYVDDVAEYFIRIGLIDSGKASQVSAEIINEYMRCLDKSKVFEKYKDIMANV